MKRAFVMGAKRHLASALVAPETRNAIRIGDRICADRLLDLGHGVVIHAGLCGTIDHIDDDTGAAEVLMDSPIPGLREWDNHLLLQPFDTDDILDDLTVSSGTLRSCLGLVPRWVRVSGTSVALSACASLLHHMAFAGWIENGATVFTTVALTAVVASLTASVS